jgi:hypothetical protein
MRPDLRRFPRICYRDLGELTLAAKHSDPDAGLITVPVRFGSISCEGADVTTLEQPTAAIIPGAEATLSLIISSRRIDLPARIVWTSGTRIGLRLRIGKLSPEVKQTYASWIVPLTNKAIARVRAS